MWILESRRYDDYLKQRASDSQDKLGVKVNEALSLTMSYGVFVCCFIAGFLRTFKMLMCTVSFLKGNMKDEISPVQLTLESFSSRITPGISIPQNTLWETGFHCVDTSERAQ